MNLDVNLLLPRYQVYWLLMTSVHVNGDAIVDMLAEMEVCPRFNPACFLKWQIKPVKNTVRGWSWNIRKADDKILWHT